MHDVKRRAIAPALVVRVMQPGRGASDDGQRLLERHRPWLWKYVSRHMSAGQRAFETSEDVVQDVLRRLLEQGPAFIPQDEDQFRRLVATVVLNHLRNRHDWIHAAKRSPGQGKAQDSDAISRIGVAAHSKHSPSRIAARREEEGFLHLALTLIDPEDAQVIRLKEWQGSSYAAIGQELGVAEGTARMRFRRAVQRMGAMAKRLMEGNLKDLAPDLEPWNDASTQT
jgi:RNA polymerase sigma factor (sigma-70 family)